MDCLQPSTRASSRPDGIGKFTALRAGPVGVGSRHHGSALDTKGVSLAVASFSGSACGWTLSNSGAGLPPASDPSLALLTMRPACASERPHCSQPWSDTSSWWKVRCRSQSNRGAPRSRSRRVRMAAEPMLPSRRDQWSIARGITVRLRSSAATSLVPAATAPGATPPRALGRLEAAGGSSDSAADRQSLGKARTVQTTAWTDLSTTPLEATAPVF